MPKNTKKNPCFLAFYIFSTNFANGKILYLIKNMKIKGVAETLERFAPLPLQESYDNAGLQIGLTEAEDVSGVLLCLDVTEKVIAEAEAMGCNMIVAHHPLLFRPLRRIVGATQVERCVALAIQKQIAIYAAHTNLDNAPGGVNFMIAERLGLNNVHFLLPNSKMDGGSGVVGTLPKPMHTAEFIAWVTKQFGIEAVQHTEGPGRILQTVALCGGAGEFLLDEAIKVGADVFLTGEMGYHRYFGHENDILIGVMGHYQSERFTIQLLHRMLESAHPDLRVVETQINTNPILLSVAEGIKQ